MTYTVEWDPLAFVQEQDYGETPGIAIQDAIVLIGANTRTQAMTCIEYLQQTWPSIGVTIELIQNVLRPPYTSGSLPGGVLMSVLR
jgi:hypothetical protein